ncbi:MAG: hypothetical protein Kow0042_23740 [Calditrichia bacterium]
MAIHRRKRSQTAYQLRLKVKNTATNVATALAIFLIIFLLTAFFIIYQWKDITITNYLNDLGKLNDEILELEAEFSRLQIRKNELINRVPARAEQMLGMVVNLENKKFEVDQKKLESYEKKEQKESQ